MKVDIISIFKGAIDIEIKGSKAERFLNLAYLDGIELQNIKHNKDCIYARVPLNRAKDLRAIARNSGAAFHICKRVGLPFYNDFMKRRPALIAMIVIAVFLFFFVSSIVFTLDVGSPYPISNKDKQKVMDLAAQAGVEPGSSRWGINMDEVEAYILSNFDQLVFAQVQENGVHLTINIVKRVDVDKEEAIKAPGDIVASCDGIIEDILVLVGQPAVEPGDAVEKGDILIYGWQGDESTAAKGMVTGVIWQDGYGECALQEKTMEPTGNEAMAIGLNFDDGPYINLLGANLDKYEHYQVNDEVLQLIQWRKQGPFVEVILRKIVEKQMVINTYTYEQAQTIAQQRAKENVKTNILEHFGENNPKNLIIVDEIVENIELDPELARSYAKFQYQVEIGIYKPI